VLSGTFEFFALGDVLSLIERAEASGALVVQGREVDGALYFARGQLCAGEIGDVSGPVEGRHALEVRLLEVMVPLLRARTAKFEFRVDAAAAWPTTVDVAIASVFDRAREIARDWSSIMKAIGNFETALDRTGEITTDAITLSHLGFRVLELVDGKRSIREVARRAGVTLVAVAPEVRALLDAGAVRVVEEEPGDRTRVDLVVDGTAPSEPDAGADSVPPPVPPVPEPDPEPSPEDLEPTLEPVGAAQARSEIVVDRSELLRMFSGLKGE
jgi:hypothetical protein